MTHVPREEGRARSAPRSDRGRLAQTSVCLTYRVEHRLDGSILPVTRETSYLGALRQAVAYSRDPHAMALAGQVRVVEGASGMIVATRRLDPTMLASGD